MMIKCYQWFPKSPYGVIRLIRSVVVCRVRIAFVSSLVQMQTVVSRAKNDYLEAVAGMEKHLLRKSEPNKLVYLGELLGGHNFSPKMVGCYNMTVIQN